MSGDEARTLATIIRHRDFVREALGVVVRDLDHRALVHDESKLRADEFDGFARINRIAREHEYGSVEYLDSMRREKGTISRHYSRNSHHPEHHERVEDMGLLDLIEMVCDWWAAAKAYGNEGFTNEFFRKQRERFGFTEQQWWVIQQVGDLLTRERRA